MDLLGEPRALRFLGLDDPHLDLGRKAVAAARDEAAVAALQEEPGRLQIAESDLELGEVRLVGAELPSQRPDIGAECPDPGILGTGLGGLGSTCVRRRPIGRAIGNDEPRACRRRAPLELVELVAERLPSAQSLAVRGAVALADAPQDVGAIGDRLVGLGLEAVDPGVDRIPHLASLGQIAGVAQPGRGRRFALLACVAGVWFGPCGVHRPPSIRVATHAKTRRAGRARAITWSRPAGWRPA